MALHSDTRNRLKKNGLFDHIAHVATVGRYLEVLAWGKSLVKQRSSEVSLYNVARLTLPGQMLGLGKELLRHGIHEPSATRLYERFLEPGERIFEAGANIGYYISVAERALAGNVTFLAVEPDPEIFQTLGQNVGFLENRIHVEQLAVSDNSGEIPFFQSASSNLGSTRRSRRTDDRALIVETKTIDNLCEFHNFHPSFLRMDIEGAEVFALRGAKMVLATFRPKIFMELHPQLMSGKELSEIFEILRANDYRTLTIVDRSYDSPTALRFLKRAQPRTLDIDQLEALLNERYFTALGVFSRSVFKGLS
jgi:FkbM family methyltransferase